MEAKNTDNKNTAIWFLIVAAILTIINFGVFTCDRGDRQEYIEKITTDTVLQTDTEYVDYSYSFRQPVFKTKTFLRRDTIYRDTGKVITLPIERLEYSDEVIMQDSAAIQYRATVSGYNPSLDSISFDLSYPKIKEYQYITTTETVVKQPPRFTFGPSIGFGYGFFNKKPDLYAGFTATYRLN